MEVTIGDRRLKMIDGEICIRAIRSGKETKEETWKAIKFCINTRYYRCNITIDGTRKIFLKHRLVYKLHNPDWDVIDTSMSNHIDHINGNPLDNRIENLRKVTQQQNQHNQVRAKGYILRPSGTYQANIGLNDKTIYLGTYATEDEARQAYLKAKLKYHNIL
jgi:hypothetical protein